MDRYKVLDMIGEGSFGRVYRGRRRYSGHTVALKVGARKKNKKKTEKKIINNSKKKFQKYFRKFCRALIQVHFEK